MASVGKQARLAASSDGKEDGRPRGVRPVFTRCDAKQTRARGASAANVDGLRLEVRWGHGLSMGMGMGASMLLLHWGCDCTYGVNRRRDEVSISSKSMDVWSTKSKNHKSLKVKHPQSS